MTLPDQLRDQMFAAIESKLALYERAKSGDLEAIIFYLRNVAGWRD